MRTRAPEVPGLAALASVRRFAVPWLGVAALVGTWDLALRFRPESLLPSPLEVAAALGELAADGTLVRHVVASLFRVLWGFSLAVAAAIPAGLTLGRHRRLEIAVSPLLELLRPISPLAWIPIAILWLGVGDLAAVAIIFLATFLPLTLAVRQGVAGISPVHLQAGRNFGLQGGPLLRRVVLPALLPRLIVGLRLALGIAWLVVVAAEMIAVNSGLGFLIIDARNAGNRYDIVVAAMVLIGVVGVGLDAFLRRLERLPQVGWSQATAGAGGAP